MPIYGTGQGSANSPASIWCFLSSCLTDAYDTTATLAEYFSPDESTSVSLGLVAFVDNCNGQVNNFLAPGSETTQGCSVLHAGKCSTVEQITSFKGRSFEII